MRHSSIQFAPSRRLQEPCLNSRRVMVPSDRKTRPQAMATTMSASARNVRITWKVILLLWLALMAALLLRGNATDVAPASASPETAGAGPIHALLCFRPFLAGPEFRGGVRPAKTSAWERRGVRRY